MAFNRPREREVPPTRAAATLTGTPRLTRATTATVRRTLIAVPARVATSARRLTLHLPRAWPWQHAWTVLFERVHAPPATTSDLTTQPPPAARPRNTQWNTPAARPDAHPCSNTITPSSQSRRRHRKRLSSVDPG